MEHTELTLIRKEVNRLQSMVDILLEQNTQLRQANYQYQLQLNSLLNGQPSNDERIGDAANVQRNTLPEMDGANNLQCHTSEKMDMAAKLQRHSSEKMDGVTKLQHHSSEKMDGVTNLQRYTSEIMDGVTKLQHDTSEIMDGVMKLQHDTSEKMDGVKNVQLPIASGMDGGKKFHDVIIGNEMLANTPFTSHALHSSATPGYNSDAQGATDTVKKINSDMVWNKLAAMNPKSNTSGLHNTTAILIALHQQPKQSMKDLQKLTGLSEDGITKRIMAMKKMGMIVRAPGRRLLLTARSETILNESRI